jgi:hypothetical protein
MTARRYIPGGINWQVRTVEEPTFRYDLAGDTPRVILITDNVGSRRAVPRLSYVVLPQR